MIDKSFEIKTKQLLSNAYLINMYSKARAFRLRRSISLVDNKSPIEKHSLEFAVHHAYLYVYDMFNFSWKQEDKKKLQISNIDIYNER